MIRDKVFRADVVLAVCDDVEFLRYENWFSQRANDWRDCDNPPQVRDWLGAIWERLGTDLVAYVQGRIRWACLGGYAKGAKGKRRAAGEAKKKKGNRGEYKRVNPPDETPTRQTSTPFNVEPIGTGTVGGIIGRAAARAGLPTAGKYKGKGRGQPAATWKGGKGKRRFQRKRERAGMVQRLATADRAELESLALGNLFANDNRNIRECWEGTIPIRRWPDNPPAAHYCLVALRRAIARAVGRAIARVDELNAAGGYRVPQPTERTIGGVDLDGNVVLRQRDKGGRIPIWQHARPQGLVRLCENIRNRAVNEGCGQHEGQRLTELWEMVATLTAGNVPPATLARYRKRMRSLCSLVRNYHFGTLFDGVTLPAVPLVEDSLPLPPFRSPPATVEILGTGGSCGNANIDDCRGLAFSLPQPTRPPLARWFVKRLTSTQFHNEHPERWDLQQGQESATVALPNKGGY